VKLKSKIVLFIFSVVSVFSWAAEKTDSEKMLEAQRTTIEGSALLMVGMALTQNLNGDYYIGAMYLDENVQFDRSVDFLLIDVPRRMEFRFADPSGVSARSFKRKLSESMRINNPRQSIKDESQNITRFFRLFSGRYKKGDSLTIDFHPDIGVRVSLNGRVLGEIERSQGLYKLILNTWVGRRPPHSQFKEGIIGNNEGDFAVDLLRKYISL
jgi:hypothetical protein